MCAHTYPDLPAPAYNNEREWELNSYAMTDGLSVNGIVLQIVCMYVFFTDLCFIYAIDAIKQKYNLRNEC
jgi:hypothetical protein